VYIEAAIKAENAPMPEGALEIINAPGKEDSERTRYLKELKRRKTVEGKG
jgi:hypothetical protein